MTINNGNCIDIDISEAVKMRCRFCPPTDEIPDYYAAKDLISKMPWNICSESL